MSAVAALPAVGEAWGTKPKTLTYGRIGLYAFLAISALFFLLPLYVMIGRPKVMWISTMPVSEL